MSNGKRGLSLDEALALSELLGVALRLLLSPPDGEVIWLTDSRGVDRSGLNNWLLFADPLLLGAAGQRTRLRLHLVHDIEKYAQAILDAKSTGDEEGEHHAIQALEGAILAHNKGIGEVEGDDDA